MTKTVYPHAHLLPEQKVARLGYDTRSLIEKAQAERATVPGGEGAQRRATTPQITLAGIEAREHERLKEDIAYAEEMTQAAAMLSSYRGDLDGGMFPGVYPNVVDQYRDFDIDPDRYANMFIRDAQYRLERHNGRPGRRAEQKAERQERRRERNRHPRRNNYLLPIDEYPF